MAVTAADFWGKRERNAKPPFLSSAQLEGKTSISPLKSLAFEGAALFPRDVENE